MTVKYHSNFEQTHPFSQDNAAIHLSADTEDNFTVAGQSRDKYVAIFTYPSDSSVFVSISATAAFPTAGNITYPSESQFKPHKRYVSGGDVVSLISDAAVLCGVALYRIE